VTGARSSWIPAGVEIEGSIEGAGDLVVAGAVHGPIDLDGTLDIAPEGRVEGAVKARGLTVRGVLVGDASVEGALRIEASATLIGDARAERVAVEDGARVRGRVRMRGEPTAEPAPARTAPAPEGGAEVLSPRRRRRRRREREPAAEAVVDAVEEARDAASLSDEVMHDGALDDEARHDGALDDEARHDEARHDEARHDEARHDEATDDEARDDEARDDEATAAPAPKPRRSRRRRRRRAAEEVVEPAEAAEPAEATDPPDPDEAPRHRSRPPAPSFPVVRRRAARRRDR
jgi:cytoskeletal protein CcmA (bactofilin family)